jgi:hypothetical protein
MVTLRDRRHGTWKSWAVGWYLVETLNVRSPLCMTTALVVESGTFADDEAEKDVARGGYVTIEFTSGVRTKAPHVNWVSQSTDGLRRALTLEDQVLRHYQLFNIKASPAPTTALCPWVTHNLELTPNQLCREVNSTAP